MTRSRAHGHILPALLALAALGGCRKPEPPPAPAVAEEPHPSPASLFRRPSADELKAAKAAGFPTDFASCQTTPGARTAVWSCGLKKDSHIAHDPSLRGCAALVGHDPNEPFGISECGLIYWDKAVKLPLTWEDCHTRFLDEPGIVQVRGQELCLVFVSFMDEELFAQCRKTPYSEYRDSFCRYPLAGPNWRPPGRTPGSPE